jgi:hypothetical protein
MFRNLKLPKHPNSKKEIDLHFYRSSRSLTRSIGSFEVSKITEVLYITESFRNIAKRQNL